MKKMKFNLKWIFICSSIFCLALNSCRDKNKECIKYYMDDGYSYDDAVDACNDVDIDSEIR